MIIITHDTKRKKKEEEEEEEEEGEEEEEEKGRFSRRVYMIISPVYTNQSYTSSEQPSKQPNSVGKSYSTLGETPQCIFKSLSSP